MHAEVDGAIKVGALLGLSTTISYVLLGKIVGMSGLLSQLLTFRLSKHSLIVDAEYKSKLALLGGLIFMSGFVYINYDTKKPFQQTSTDGPLTYLLAGFLVGLGTRLSNGCTSGHGLCGIPRLSVRSIVAVLCFLTTGIFAATFNLKQYIPNNKPTFIPDSILPELNPLAAALICVSIGVLLFLFIATPSLGQTEPISTIPQHLVSFVVGAVFGVGLLVSGMTQRDKVNEFLDLSKLKTGEWDPSLLAVLMTGVGINLLSFNFMLKFV